MTKGYTMQNSHSSVDGVKLVVGRNGMVSTAHPLATNAGINILKAEGTAFDAAVAIAATLNVVEPQNSGIGGYGTILVYDAASNKTRFLDSSGRIPLNVDSDVFRAPTPNHIENRSGVKAISTPGNVNAWWAMSSEYGKLEWHELFEEATRIAEIGFEVTENLSKYIMAAFPKFSEYAKEIYGKEGTPLEPGDRLIQMDLSQSLRLIAKMGPMALYGGILGQTITASISELGGFLTLEDLVMDQAEWWDPICINYRGYTVVTASPPATAFPALIRLGLMSQFDNTDLGHNTIEYLHRFAEVTKHAYWCRYAYAGDPEISPPPLMMLLSEVFWKSVVGGINLTEATPFAPLNEGIKSGENTTHFVVADKWGNVVSATQTIGNWFGSHIMVDGTGIWLNNSLEYCTFEPKGNPMDAHAGHRKLSGDCPTLIFKGEKPWVAIGTPGGHTIGQTIPQMIINLIDFGMDIQEAISAPRISFEAPNILSVEYKIGSAVRSGLIGLKHSTRIIKALGNAHGLTIDYDAKGNPVQFEGAADPRGIGLAKGF